MSFQDYAVICGSSTIPGASRSSQGLATTPGLATTSVSATEALSSLNRPLSGMSLRNADSEDEDSPKDDNTVNITIMDITERERPYGDRPQISRTSVFNQAKGIDKKYTQYALLLRRMVNQKGKGVGTALEIWSPVIRKVLRELLAECTYLNLVACPIVISQPYHALFHYREEIRGYAEKANLDAEARSHLSVLVNFMNTNLLKTEREYNRHIIHGLTNFSLLWTIFRPETIVVLETDQFKECYRVNSCREVMLESGETDFQITVWHWDYNGSLFGPAKSTLAIREFKGTRVLTELDVYPLSALEESDRVALERELVARGKKWRGLVCNSHRQYSGPAWTAESRDPKSLEDLVTRHVDGRVILDYQTHQENNYSLATVLYSYNGIIENKKVNSDQESIDYLYRRRYDLEEDREPSDCITEEEKRALKNMKCHANNEEYNMSNDEALLCPARIRGFALSEKRWAFFLVGKVEDIGWSDSAFDEVEVDEAVKFQLLAVVKTHYTQKNLGTIVASKGVGLVVLLHGPPGTGKTLTAESIAEHVRRPLYYIAAGELGDYAKEIEPKLKKMFNLAKSWQAILLLDEADVFLAKRKNDEIFRNSVVSVFLRLLEYYEGILFLTTNRLDEFDPAFQSRLQLRLSYEELDSTKRMRIWRNILGKIKDCESWGDDVFERLGRDFDINGREIANLSRTAAAVATYQRTPLTVSILQSVYDLNFAGYVR